MTSGRRNDYFGLHEMTFGRRYVLKVWAILIERNGTLQFWICNHSFKNKTHQTKSVGHIRRSHTTSLTIGGFRQWRPPCGPRCPNFRALFWYNLPNNRSGFGTAPWRILDPSLLFDWRQILISMFSLPQYPTLLFGTHEPIMNVEYNTDFISAHVLKSLFYTKQSMPCVINYR